MAHIFISHIHEDAEIALAIKKFLMEMLRMSFTLMRIRGIFPRTGSAQSILQFHKPLDIFVSSDPERILPGEDWLAQMKLALESAIIVIPLLTRQSLTRPWVNFETGAAWLAKKG